MSDETIKTGEPLKVYVSYDRAKDHLYKSYFDSLMEGSGNIKLLPSVPIVDVDESLKVDAFRQKIRSGYLLDSTVTIVLVGVDTWKLKNVDWEIGAGIPDSRNHARSGLLGIILPTYPRLENDRYDPHTLPPRLNANVRCGFARLHNWAYDASAVLQWIKEAYENRDNVIADNTYPHFVTNLSGSKWHD